MWRHAGDKLVASMLMLAHAWPLAQALDNHILLTFIDQQHRAQQELLLEQDVLSQHTMQPALRQEEQGQEGSSGGASPEKDREEDGGKDADLRCARCQKRIGKVSHICNNVYDISGDELDHDVQHKGKMMLWKQCMFGQTLVYMLRYINSNMMQHLYYVCTSTPPSSTLCVLISCVAQAAGIQE